MDQRVESNHVGFVAPFIEHLVCTLGHACFAEPPDHGVSVNTGLQHNLCEEHISGVCVETGLKWYNGLKQI